MSDILASYSAERRAILSDRSLSNDMRKARLAAAKQRMRFAVGARKSFRKSRKLSPVKVRLIKKTAPQ
jgi:hypothetical protein